MAKKVKPKRGYGRNSGGGEGDPPVPPKKK